MGVLDGTKANTIKRHIKIKKSYTMIKLHSIDNHEQGQIVFVWNIIPMPGNNIKWTVVLISLKQVPLKLGYHLVTLHISVFIPCHRGEEIPGICKTICS
jgi:hypothetical protein